MSKIVKTLDFVARHLTSRRSGRTSAVCEWAKKNNAIVLAPTAWEANRLQRDHGVKTASICSNLEGLSDPIILDHRTMEVLLGEAADEIERLQARVGKLETQLDSALLEAAYWEKVEYAAVESRDDGG